jgi:hypothetical protein
MPLSPGTMAHFVPSVIFTPGSPSEISSEKRETTGIDGLED